MVDNVVRLRDAGKMDKNKKEIERLNHAIEHLNDMLDARDSRVRELEEEVQTLRARLYDKTASGAD